MLADIFSVPKAATVLHHVEDSQYIRFGSLISRQAEERLDPAPIIARTMCERMHQHQRSLAFPYIAVDIFAEAFAAAEQTEPIVPNLERNPHIEAQIVERFHFYRFIPTEQGANPKWID